MRSFHEVDIPAELELLRRDVLRAALRVHRHLGPGFREGIYRRCLAHALSNDGITVREERWLGVEFEGLVLRNAVRTDLIVDERLLVELKAVERFHPVHRGQLLSYLKASGLSMGVLLNFNVERLMKQGYDRIVHPRHLKAI